MIKTEPCPTPGCDNQKSYKSKVCIECFAVIKSQGTSADRTCDDSGNSDLCETVAKHQHCECGEPMDEHMEIQMGCCILYCAKEMAGISLRALDLPLVTASNDVNNTAHVDGRLGYSPFKRQKMVYAHGDFDSISQAEANQLNWDAKERSEKKA